jgi:hypothetical protein
MVGQGVARPLPQVTKGHDDRRLSVHLRSKTCLHKWSLSISYETLVT